MAIGSILTIIVDRVFQSAFIYKRDDGKTLSFTVFPRRASCDFFKLLIKIRQVAKATAVGDSRYVICCFGQRCACGFNPEMGQKFNRTAANGFLKGVHEVT